jgi:hypothetical protein
MTVGEFKAKLENLDPKTHVCVIHESEDGMDIFGVGDVAVHKGTPKRHPDTRKALFSFDGLGPESWLFISTEDE